MASPAEIACRAIRDSRRPDLRLAEKAVLQAIASRLNADGVAFCGYDTIAGDAGTTRSVVAEVVPFLRRAGVLVVDAPRGARAANLYRIDVDALDRMPEEAPSARRTRARKGGIRAADGGGPLGGPSTDGAEVRVADGSSPPEVRVADGGGPLGGPTTDGAEVRVADGSSLPEVRVADGGGPRGGPEDLSLDHEQKDPEKDPEREVTTPRSSKPRARGAARVEAAPCQVGLAGIASASDEGGKTKRRKPLIPLPDGWAPSPRMQQWALATAIKVGVVWTLEDVEHETATFCTNARAGDGRWADWGAAWENWIRKGIKFAWKQGATAEARAGGPGPRRAVGAQPLGDESAPARGLFDSEEFVASSGGGYL